MYKSNLINLKTKPVYLILVFLFFSDFIFCQNTDSQYIIGGSFSLSQSKTQSSNLFRIDNSDLVNTEAVINGFNFSIAPYIGKAINSSTYIGIQPTFFHGISNSNNIDSGVEEYLKRTDFSLGVQLFLRKILLLEKKLHYYLQPNIAYSYAFGKEERFAPALIENKGNLVSLGLDVGAIYKLGEKWNLLLEIPTIGYSYSKFRSADSPDSIITCLLYTSPSPRDS